MPLISQTQASDMIHKQTGRSIAWSEAAVKELRKVQDGARQKVCLRDVQILIEKENAPLPEPTIKFRPISAKQMAAIEKGRIARI